MKTNKVIDKALDGILFIDEAYSPWLRAGTMTLKRGSEHSYRSYGERAKPLGCFSGRIYR